MGTVATSTNATATKEWFERHPEAFSNGLLFDPLYDGTNLICRYSADGGTTWQTPTLGATIGAYIRVAVKITPDNTIHLAVENNGANVYYIRGTPDAGCTGYTWAAAYTVSAGANDSYPNIEAFQTAGGWTAFFWWTKITSTTNVMSLKPLDIASPGGAVTAQTGWTQTYTNGSIASGAGSIAADSAKNLGAGFSTGWWGAGFGVRYRPATEAAGVWTWGAIEPVYEADYAKNRGVVTTFDGQGRAVLAWIDTTSSQVILRRRTGANTWAAVGTLPTISPTGLSLVCNGNDIYLWYTAGGLYFVRWNDAAGTWDPAVMVDSDATVVHFSLRRIVAAGVMDGVATKGAASPYSVVHYRQSIVSGTKLAMVI